MIRHDGSPGACPRQGRRGARQLPEPRGGTRRHAGLAVLLPQALLLASRQRRPGGPAARVRAAGLRGRGGAGHRPPRPPSQPRRRLGPRGGGHRRERLRRLRPALRRPRLERAVQGHRRLHPGGPPAARRPDRRTRRAAPADLGERRAGPGRLARPGHAMGLRRHRGRSVPARHARTRRPHPHRHAHRLDRGDPRRRGGGRGQRGRAVVGPAAQPHRRGRLPAGAARRHAPRRRRRALRCLRRRPRGRLRRGAASARGAAPASASASASASAARAAAPPRRPPTPAAVHRAQPSSRRASRRHTRPVARGVDCHAGRRSCASAA